MTGSTTIYLPEFDRHIEAATIYRPDLRSQLVYSILAYDNAIVAAGSPFMNRSGWKWIQHYEPFLAKGLLKIPLDRRFDGHVDQYISYRLGSLPSKLPDGSPNPERLAYSGPAAQQILDRIACPQYTLTRALEGHEIFRSLVLEDLHAPTRESLAHVLDGFCSIRGDVDDALAMLRERALDRTTIFQRFDLVSRLPSVIRKNDAYRTKINRQLDALFFLANARCASNNPITDSYENSLAHALEVFCRRYKPGKPTLHSILMALPPQALIDLKYSEAFRAFLGELSHWLTDEESWGVVIGDAARRKSHHDAFRTSWGRTVVLSVYGAAISYPLGITIATGLSLPAGFAGFLASVIVGCLSFVTRGLQASPAARVYKDTILRRIVDGEILRNRIS